MPDRNTTQRTILVAIPLLALAAAGVGYYAYERRADRIASDEALVRFLDDIQARGEAISADTAIKSQQMRDETKRLDAQDAESDRRIREARRKLEELQDSRRD